ncbi:MAG: RIO1 family regulatory kinase/ATPase [Lutisporaceae bacterium]
MMLEFISRRNRVLLDRGLVIKKYPSEGIAAFEERTLNKLYVFGLKVPKVISSGSMEIQMEYIEGQTLLEKLELMEKENAGLELQHTLSEMLADWFLKYYQAVDFNHTSILRGDVNCRNFIVNDLGIWGVDFEEEVTGEREKDIGRLIAYIFTYEPSFTIWKFEFCHLLEAVMCQKLSLNRIKLHKYQYIEYEEMSKRRLGFKVPEDLDKLIALSLED